MRNHDGGYLFAWYGRRVDDAEKTYARGLEVSPGYLDLRIGVGRMHLRQGKLEQAKRDADGVPAPPAQRDRLFIFKGLRTVNAMSTITVHHLLAQFCDRHRLAAFALASIRPSVLCSFYRASGDLLRTRAVANHARITTTVRYVETPIVQQQNHVRIAALQGAR